MHDDRLDCLIVGGGPAGLTAAIYLARFHLRIRVVDAGSSRAAWIPVTRNHAGYPEGIAGEELLARMRSQAERYGATIERGTVETLARDGDAFVGSVAGRTLHARSVLLATGVVNRRPAMPDALHDDALRQGLLRYCPICDGFEITDKRVGVVGTGERGTKEALFLRSYTREVTLIAPEGAHTLSPHDREELAQAEVALVDGPTVDFAIGDETISVATAAGRLAFASIYPALGSTIRSELAVSIGADASEDGCLVVDDHQRTSVAHLFAAGDVVAGLDQISHAMGEGGVAATTIRNDLAQAKRLYR
jgi:thioredoxin reductase (NADPH)